MKLVSRVLRIASLVSLIGYAGSCGVWAQAFELSDSDPDGSEFRARFLATYGVNAAIEPELTEEDRPLYESVAPLLAANQQEAIDLLEPQITAESNAAFDFLLGNLYYSLGDYSAAQSWLERCVGKLPSFRRAYRTLGLCLVQQGDIAGSVPYWLKVVTLGGGDGQSYGLLGYGYLTLERYHSSLKAYEMARMFDPDSLDFKRGHAQCLLMTGQQEQAISLFDELVAEHPKNADFWLLQANAYLAKDRLKEAIANLEFVKELGGANWQSLMLLGDLYLERSAYGLATDTYRFALESGADPSLEAAMQPLRRLLSYLLFTEAEGYLGSLESAFGARLSQEPNEELVVCRSQIQLERGDVDVAIAGLRALVESDPLQGSALLLLGDAFQKRGEAEEAVYYLERARSVDSVSVDALVALGRLEVERGRFREAVRYLREAQRLEPRENVQRYLERVEQIATPKRRN